MRVFTITGLCAVGCAMLAMSGTPFAQAPVEGEKPPPAASADTSKSAPDDEASLRFNFRDVPLDTVLDYLSEAAGFTVVREVQVEGRVDVESFKPLNKDEAVALLNTVLNAKGYAAIRNERTLTILRSEDAKQRDIPVKSGSAPEAIPKTGEMVTQIIPVRHADVTQLLDNLKPLLPSYALANANTSSNAIVLTATQTDVRRMAEIIEALDMSITAISEIKVFSLTYANATDTANIINSVFQLPAGQGQPGIDIAAIRAARARAGRGRGPIPMAPGADSAAKLAAARVMAVGDERTNSVIVSAPGDSMPLIATVVEQIDKEGMPTAEIRVFALHFADAAEMVQIINDAFGPNAAVGTASGQQVPRGTARPAVAAAKAGAKAGGSRQSGAVTLAHAVADYRTNSVVVAAEAEVMEQVAEMVDKLESNPARDQKVFIYKLKNADAQEVATILMGMLSQTGSNAIRPRQTATSSRSGTGSSYRGSNSTSRRGSSSRTGR